MISWYSISILFIVLQISSASENEDYFVGEHNGKNYTIIQYDGNPDKLVLNVKELMGSIEQFPLPTCESLFNYIRNGNCVPINEVYFGRYKTYIYRVENSTILKRWLLTSDRKLTNPVPVAESKSPIQRVTVYNDTIRIDTNIHNCTKIYYKDAPKCDVPDDDTSCKEDQVVTGKPRNVSENLISAEFRDDNFSKQDQPFTKKSKVLSLSYEYFVDKKDDEFLVIVNLTALSNDTNGKCVSINAVYLGKHKVYVYKVEGNRTVERRIVNPDGKTVNNVTIVESNYPIESISLRGNKISITTLAFDKDDHKIVKDYEDLPKCDVPENDTSCKEYQAHGGKPKSLCITELTTTKLPGITIFQSELKIIAVGTIVFALVLLVLQRSSASENEDYFVGEHNGKNYTITKYDGTPDRLVLNINESSGMIKHFNLSTCDECNGNCISIADSYFGKHKIYIYRIEEEKILKRWLVAPDGGLTKSVVVAKTKLSIREVHVNESKIHMTLGTDEDEHPIKENYEDLPRCDVPENDTSCEEYQHPDEIPKVMLKRFEYFVGENNSKNYTIVQYDENSTRLVLTVRSSKNSEEFSLSTCDKKYVAPSHRSINSQGTHLFVHLMGEGDSNFLLIVDLVTLSDSINNGDCIPVDGIYFGEHKIYVYRVKENNILRRWVLTPDGELTNPVVVARTKYSIKQVHVYVENSKIITEGEHAKGFYVNGYHTDLPRCDTPENDISCTEYQAPEEKPKALCHTEQTAGPLETPVITISKDDLKVVVIITVLQISSSSECNPYFVGAYNGTSYTIKEYEEYISPDRLTLVVKERGGINEEFPLSTCGRKYILIGEHTIKDQGNYLFFHIKGEIGNGRLVIVDLMALSDDIFNGDCIPADMIILGKYKTYIYRIVDSSIIKRWVVGSDNNLTHPVVIGKSKYSIGEAYFNSGRIKVNINGYNSILMSEYYEDAPRCDVPENDTSCEEYQSPEEISTGTSFEYDLKVVFIAAGALFFILILLGILYCLWNWKSKSIQKLFDHLNNDSNDYTSVPHDISGVDG
ncbi:hypothetical protein FO519_005529 [Halicephalobus sp. NKZ332]|nr:hypothetical protein FO519_005529 [Halicephalobus sp. NKZ332]